MTKAILTTLVSVIASQAMAAEIISARLDARQENVLIEVRHGGGCGEHQYSLQLRGCAESMPVQCQADLVHRSNDMCEAIIGRTATISLRATGIVGSYYSGGSLRIKGDNGSSAFIRLPRNLPENSVSNTLPTLTPGVRCVTHTGSFLTVSPNQSVVTIQPASGRSERFDIVDTEVIVLESFPSILQSTYKLNDGRSIVISIRGSESTGTGYYIRTAGGVSPSFECVVTAR